MDEPTTNPPYAFGPPHRTTVAFTAETTRSEVPGSILDGDPLDYLLAAYAERADRDLFLALGAECLLRKDTINLSSTVKDRLAEACRIVREVGANAGKVS